MYAEQVCQSAWNARKCLSSASAWMKILMRSTRDQSYPESQQPTALDMRARTGGPLACQESGRRWRQVRNRCSIHPFVSARTCPSDGDDSLDCHTAFWLMLDLSLCSVLFSLLRRSQESEIVLA